MAGNNLCIREQTHSRRGRTLSAVSQGALYTLLQYGNSAAMTCPPPHQLHKEEWNVPKRWKILFLLCNRTSRTLSLKICQCMVCGCVWPLLNQTPKVHDAHIKPFQVLVIHCQWKKKNFLSSKILLHFALRIGLTRYFRTVRATLEPIFTRGSFSNVYNFVSLTYSSPPVWDFS